MIKVLFGIMFRQTTGFVDSLFRLICLNWAVPDFSILSRRPRLCAHPAVQGQFPQFHEQSYLKQVQLPVPMP
jgi:Transposase DDE domain